MPKIGFMIIASEFISSKNAYMEIWEYQIILLIRHCYCERKK